MAIDIETKAEFCRLANDLSPENLCCDGELHGKALADKTRRLAEEWTALEDKVGCAVSEGEVYGWWEEVSRWREAERARKLAESEHVDGLDHPVADRWFRMTADGHDSVYHVYDMREIVRTFGGGPAKVADAERYTANCRLMRSIGLSDSLGAFPTLREAVEAGERALREIVAAGPDAVRRAWPKWPDSRIRSDLASIPDPLPGYGDEPAAGPRF
jgi:hypothetical protein